MDILRNWWEKFKDLIVENQFVLYLLVFFSAYFLYLWLQITPSFLDPDSFYHLKMSKLIAENGPVLNFPWLQFTVLKNYFVDHHFLYHVFAIPFIQQIGDFEGIKLYTVVLASCFILTTYTIFKKQKVPYPEILSLILLLSPALLFRLSLTKATAFSLIFLFWGIYSIFKRKHLALIILSFFYVWSYGGFLLLLAMAGLYAVINTLYRIFASKEVYFLKNLQLIGASLLGIVLGIVTSPYFPQNLKFYWQQLVEIGIINYRGTVNVGGEWYPYDILQLLSDSGIVIIFWIIFFVLFFVFIKKQRPKSIFFLLTSVIFLLLTLKSKRYVEYFIPNMLFFTAYTLKYILHGKKINDYIRIFKRTSYLTGILLQFVVIYLSFAIPVIIIKDLYNTSETFKGGIPFDRFAGISEYLKQNTEPGEVIMQTDWDDFPMLFYYNDKDYYIVGLDPTFMYNFNPALYTLFADITTAKKTDNLSTEIKEVFKARYFIVDNDRAILERNLQNDGKFISVYSDADGTIYQIR